MKAILGTFYKDEDKAIKYADDKNRTWKDGKARWLVLDYDNGYLVIEKSQVEKVYLIPQKI